MKIAAAVAFCIVLAACASTSQPGWSGKGAEPFGTAESACRTATADVDAAMRDHEFEACMAERGWHRP